MNDGMKEAENAVGLRKCQHLYLRGNFQMDMFFDKVDKVNVWNRVWLSAKATGVLILSVKILDNHLHINAIVESDEQRTRFKRHFRMSVSQYHNHRYVVSGSLGERKFKHGVLKDVEDLRDCICYHVRNVLHHGISANFMDYPFSTIRFVFGLSGVGQKGVYVRETLPDNLARAYLPVRVELPVGWEMTAEGMIVPPAEVFRADLVEALFDDSREVYLEALSHKTMREAADKDETASTVGLRDVQVAEFVKGRCSVPIPSMNANQKMEAISLVLEEFPGVSVKMLTRIFGIPYSTLRYRMKCWHLHSRTVKVPR